VVVAGRTHTDPALSRPFLYPSALHQHSRLRAEGTGNLAGNGWSASLFLAGFGKIVARFARFARLALTPSLESVLTLPAMIDAILDRRPVVPNSEPSRRRRGSRLGGASAPGCIKASQTESSHSRPTKPCRPNSGNRRSPRCVRTGQCDSNLVKPCPTNSAPVKPSVSQPVTTVQCPNCPPANHNFRVTPSPCPPQTPPCPTSSSFPPPLPASIGRFRCSSRIHISSPSTSPPVFSPRQTATTPPGPT